MVPELLNGQQSCLPRRGRRLRDGTIQGIGNCLFLFYFLVEWSTWSFKLSKAGIKSYEIKDWQRKRMSASHQSQGQNATSNPTKPTLKHFLKTWLRLFLEDLPWNKEQYYVRRRKKEAKARRMAKRAKRRERRRAAQEVHVTIQTVDHGADENQSVITFEKSSLRVPKEESMEEVKDALGEDETESIVL